MRKEAKSLCNIPSVDIQYTSIHLMSQQEKLRYQQVSLNNIAEDPVVNCTRCGLNTRLCSGHMLSIHFRYPIIHSFFLREIETIINLTCFECANPYDGADIENKIQEAIKFNIPYSTVLSNMSDIVLKKKICSNENCKSNVKYFKKTETAMFTFYYSTHVNKTLKIMPTQYIRDLLIRMKDQSRSLLLLNLMNIGDTVNIEEFLPITILVIPSKDRPPVITSSGATPQNALTSLYSNLYEIATRMNTIDDENDDKANNNVLLASQKYDILLNGKKVDGAINKNGIIPEIKGKSGMRRKVLGGTKPFGTGRSVAAGHPGDPDIVVLPREFIDNTPYPEEVTSSNIDELQYALKSNEIFNIKSSKMDIGTLQYKSKYISIGNTVGRRTRKGDVCFINRQPEMHAGSIIPLTITTFKHNSKTYIIPTNRTFSLNCDFDGDEINGVISQNVQGVEDMKEVARSDQIIVNPGDSSAMMGIRFSGIISCFLLTSKLDILPEKFFNYISLLTLHKKNHLLDIESYYVVELSDINYRSFFINKISKRIDKINNNLVERAINHKILSPEMFFFDVSIKGLCYYYDIDNDFTLEIVNDLYERISFYFDDFGSYLNTLLSSKFNKEIDYNNITSLRDKFKLLDFIIREEFDFYCDFYAEVLIAKRNNNEYETGIDDSIYVKSFINIESNRFVDKDIYIKLCNDVYDIKKILAKHKIGIIPGSFIFSISLPYYFNYEVGKIVIKDGILLGGKITASNISISSNSIVVRLANCQDLVGGEFIDGSMKFITVLNRILMNFYNYHNFTYSVDDILGNLEAYPQYNNLIYKEKVKAYARLDVRLDKILRNNNYIIPTGLEWDNFQKDILSTISAESTMLVDRIKQYVNFKNIEKFVESGTKGKELNNTQTSYLIGNIFVASNLHINKSAKTLDHDSVSYTFSSYIEGYSSSLEGVQSNAARFAINIRHSAVPATEDSSTINNVVMRKTVTTHDYSTIKVGNTNQMLVQSIYGYDALSPTRIMKVKDTQMYTTDIKSYMNYSYSSNV